ncbi:DUF1253-domain-containing protein [Tuber magnatum]|uniref:U3 small nucleolar RNA-associated protein 25 n=1 Tax=Tuber magnatum TaxID=42249 RepID=A0A317T0Q8_9PEZI|nr:DUF1253-domain-containing protein [Tuber magnatum]
MRTENRPKEIPEAEESDSDSETPDDHELRSGEDSEQDLSSDDLESGSDDNAAPAKSYDLLLQSLRANNESNQRNPKRRKLDRTKTKEDGVILLDGEDLADGPEEEEEEEEEPEEEVMDVISDDEDQSDPFESHFAGPSPARLASISLASKGEWKETKLPKSGLPANAHLSTPRGSEQTIGGRRIESLKDLNLKKKLIAEELTPLQKSLGQLVFGYVDVLYGERTLGNAEELRKMYSLHALNHVLKTRDRVLRNNARLAKVADQEIELRDQGFTRPKVLFILPTRNACVEVINALVNILQPEQQENKKRFQDTYYAPPDTERISPNKPEDFRALFSGNHDDLFRLGIKLTRKTLKYFSQFYNSDIILASPLGLRMAIGGESDKKHDYDFLSSIELVVVDQADALLMQNWGHLEHIFKHLNMIPKDPHGCDFGRVRNWYLDTNAKYFRQTLVFSGFVTPEIMKLFNQSMLNVAGKVKIQPEYTGSMIYLGVQTFTRIDPLTPAADPDARFDYFTKAILPSLLRNTSTSTLIFIPSYFDFIRMRNHLSNAPISVGAISEETPISSVTRARSHFFTGRHSVILYSGRAHHFRRYEIRGATSVVFYGLPDNPLFYREVAGGFIGRSIGEGRVKEQPRVRVIFSKWDAMKLERVVGSKRVRVMCMDKGDTFEFV